MLAVAMPAALTVPRLLAAVASAILLVVISPPDNLHYLHWFAFLPLLWALRPNDTRGNLVLSYLCGFVAVHSLFFWLTESIVRFSNIPAYAAIQIVVGYAFASGFWYAIVFGCVQPLRKHLGAAWVFLIPALEVAIEVLQLSLFPYYHGVSQYRTPLTWQLASVTGVMGVSYLIFLTNCALAEVVYRHREGGRMPWATLTVTATLFLANLGYGAWRVPRVEAEVATWQTIKVSQLQQGISMEERMDGTPRDAMLSWVRMSGEFVGEDIDLVIWPEGATPYDPRGARVGQLMTNLANNLDAPILFGGGFAQTRVDAETGRKYVEQRNSIYLMGSDGKLLQRYDKMVPLPFGEYLPLADTFPILKEIIRGPGDFEAGSEPVFFEVDGVEGRLATPICYEAILQDFVHENLAESSLFVNVTNDGWFGDTQAPHQHAMLSAVRAVENGIPMIRIAYTGVSMHVSPTGVITNETVPFTEVIRIVETPIGRVDTIYRHIGDSFAWLCVLASFCGLFGAYVRSQGTRAVTPTSRSS